MEKASEVFKTKNFKVDKIIIDKLTGDINLKVWAPLSNFLNHYRYLYIEYKGNSSDFKRLLAMSTSANLLTREKKERNIEKEP